MLEVKSGKGGSVRYREKYERSLEDKNEWKYLVVRVGFGRNFQKVLVICYMRGFQDSMGMIFIRMINSEQYEFEEIICIRQIAYLGNLFLIFLTYNCFFLK